jgi:GDP-L-fucose synthase
MNRVLVTGGSGMVGRAVQEITDGSWTFASSADADLINLQDTDALFHRVQPTHVLHLAARVGGLFCNMRFTAEMFHDNIAMNINVISCAHKYGVKKVLSCLSTCIFPDATEYPIDESMIHNGPPHSSNFGYAYAKRMIDVMNQAYHSQYGVVYTSVIPTNLFGPHDNFNLENSHVIPAIIHKCMRAIERDEHEIVIAGSGRPLRQFLFSHDFAQLLVWALFNYTEIDPIILAPSEEISIATVARVIAKVCGFSGNIKFDTSLSDGQFKKNSKQC